MLRDDALFFPKGPPDIHLPIRGNLILNSWSDSWLKDSVNYGYQERSTRSVSLEGPMMVGDEVPAETPGLDDMPPGYSFFLSVLHGEDPARPCVEACEVPAPFAGFYARRVACGRRRDRAADLAAAASTFPCPASSPENNVRRQPEAARGLLHDL